MIHKLHEFVPPFTLYLRSENARNPARKHFEKTNKSRAAYTMGPTTVFYFFFIFLFDTHNISHFTHHTQCSTKHFQA